MGTDDREQLVLCTGRKENVIKRRKKEAILSNGSSPLDRRGWFSFTDFLREFLLITIRKEAEKFSTGEISVVEEATTQR
jgi:hypothetical protein